MISVVGRSVAQNPRHSGLTLGRCVGTRRLGPEERRQSEGRRGGEDDNAVRWSDDGSPHRACDIHPTVRRAGLSGIDSLRTEDAADPAFGGPNKALPPSF